MRPEQDPVEQRRFDALLHDLGAERIDPDTARSWSDDFEREQTWSLFSLDWHGVDHESILIGDPLPQASEAALRSTDLCLVLLGAADGFLVNLETLLPRLDEVWWGWTGPQYLVGVEIGTDGVRRLRPDAYAEYKNLGTVRFSVRQPERANSTTTALLTLDAELRRLGGDSAGPTTPDLLEVRGMAADPADVIRRVTGVLTSVVQVEGSSLSLDEWATVLPDWFVRGCAPERTSEEDERWLTWWRALPEADRSHTAAVKRWSLSDWVAWMPAEERLWRWWDARVEGEDQAVVRVQVLEWPPVVGSLRWLLRVAGLEIVAEI